MTVKMKIKTNKNSFLSSCLLPAAKMTVVINHNAVPNYGNPHLEYLLPAMSNRQSVITVKDFRFHDGQLELKCYIELGGYTVSAFSVKITADRLKIRFSPAFGVEFDYQTHFEYYERDELLSAVSYHKSRQIEEGFVSVCGYINKDSYRIVALYNSVIISKFLTGHPYSQFRIVKNTDQRELTVTTLGGDLNIWFTTDNDGVDRLDVIAEKKGTLATYSNTGLVSALSQLPDIDSGTLVYDIDNPRHRVLTAYINLIAKVVLLYSRHR